jgi:hypothetical protein
MAKDLKTLVDYLSGLGIEKVRYEVSCNTHKEFVLSMGEASVLACELSGDRSFMN